ncbi:hypothetical protein MnTg02_02683 [bacterium MnTg02]|nr:hypothetical protein MnTg02_02683 [bacterium MnTg02]
MTHIKGPENRKISNGSGAKKGARARPQPLHATGHTIGHSNDRWAFKRHACLRAIVCGAQSRLPKEFWINHNFVVFYVSERTLPYGASRGTLRTITAQRADNAIN